MLYSILEMWFKDHQKYLKALTITEGSWVSHRDNQIKFPRCLVICILTKDFR